MRLVHNTGKRSKKKIWRLEDVPHRYSPLPPLAYAMPTLHQCEVRFIDALDERALSTWNLFWLSTPGLDGVPGSGANWHQHYRPVPGQSAAVMRDVRDDDLLYRKVMMHPSNFAEWFQREPDHSVYDAWKAYGRDAWVKTVLARAAEAALRIEAERPQVSGNVIKLQFRRSA